MAVETNGDGSAINPSGVYRHPDTKQELIFQATGKFGNPGADAAVRLGFVYVGPAKVETANNDGPAGTVVASLDPSAGPTADTSPQKSVAQLETDLAAARGREIAAQKAANAKSSLVDPEHQKAKDAAAAEAAKAEEGGK
jgi:hypothetical protein